MDKFYYSVYGPFIEKFIDLKRSLGYKYIGGTGSLARFDKFVANRDESEVRISKELAEEWGAKNPNESDPNRYIRIEIIRQFSLFLCQLGYPSYVPKLPKFNSKYTPYIFSKEQIINLFTACDQLKPAVCHRKSLIFIIPTLFRLLYGTGMRTSEALSLLSSDVNLEDNYLILRNCKNGKDRLIPIASSLAEVCREYLKYRNHYAQLNPYVSDRFFISPKGSPCIHIEVYAWFRKVLYNAGISHGGKGHGPRLHDIRHSFSVHSLAAMAEAGMDLYYSLPVLSTYLGHQSLGATDKYVRLTKEMYPSIIENANKLCPYLFPEILNLNNNETN
ncbi:MAG TPA: tyrosine-type recombinase/integrase [Hanamia sp.]|nr:tyrosine-type recombinase/integrase [Hanamia sp.]